MNSAMRLLQAAAAERLGYVSAWEARRLGVSRMAVTRAIRDGTLVRVAPRVYRFGAARQHAREDIIVSWLSLAHAPAIVSHWSALVWADVLRVHPEVHLLVPRSARCRQAARSAIIHTTHVLPADNELTWHQGVLATSVTRSLLDIARVCGYEEIEPLVRVSVAQGFLLVPALRQAVRERGGKADRFVRRFLRTQYRDYIRDRSRGRVLYAERMAAKGASAEIPHDLAS